MPPFVNERVLCIQLIFKSKLLMLLLTFANIFDPGQEQQNVSPDLDPNCLTL